MQKAINILLTGSILLGVLLGNSTVVQSKETVTLRWIDWGDPVQMEANQDIRDLFEADHPNIKIKVEPTAEGWDTRLLAQMAARVAPDIITGWSHYFRLWVEKNQMLDLTPYIEKYMTAEEINDYYSAQFNAFWYKGIQYALPKYISSTACYYNKDMFDEAGLKYPKKETWTWDNLLKYAQRLTKIEGGKVQYGFYMVPDNLERLNMWVLQNNGKRIDSNDDRVCLLDNPNSIEAFNFVHDLIWKYKVSPIPPSGKSGEFANEEAFMADQVAMIRTGPWLLSTLQYEKVPFRWDVVILAKSKKRAGVHFVDGYGIWKGTHYSEEAFEFVHFISGPEAAKILMEKVAMQPAHKSMAKEFVKYFPYCNAQAFVDILDYCEPTALYREHTRVRELLMPAFESVFISNQKTAEEAMREAISKINKMLSQYPPVKVRREIEFKFQQ